MYSAAPFTAAGLLHHRVGLSVLHGVAACPCDPVDWGSPSRLLRGAHRRPRPLDHGRRHDKHPWAGVLVPDATLHGIAQAVRRLWQLWRLAVSSTVCDTAAVWRIGRAIATLVWRVLWRHSALRVPACFLLQRRVSRWCLYIKPGTARPGAYLECAIVQSPPYGEARPR
jgi:hypothetical protein